MSARYGCNTQGQGPRGQAAPLLVQDGWRVVRRGDHMGWEQILVEVTTPWLSVRCGYLAREADGRCAGCENSY